MTGSISAVDPRMEMSRSGDGVSNRCIASPLQAHDGAEVYSVVFSRTKSIYLKESRQHVNRDSI